MTLVAFPYHYLVFYFKFYSFIFKFYMYWAGEMAWSLEARIKMKNFMCMGVFHKWMYVCMYTTSVLSAYGGQKRVLGSLKQVVDCHVHAGN